MKVLFVVCVSIALAQLSCFEQPVNNCTGVSFTGQYFNGTCEVAPGFCFRNTTGFGACDASTTTCTGPACAAGTSISNGTSCSKCTDQCFGASQTDCSSAAMRGACTWVNPYCSVLLTGSIPCSSSSKASCIGEAGCYWLSYNSTVCGVSRFVSQCIQCNATANPYDLPTRSALFNNIGQTCTWAAAAPYQASSLTITDVAQSSDTNNCPSFTAADMTGDPLAITAAAAASGTFSGVASVDASTTAICQSPTSAPTSATTTNITNVTNTTKPPTSGATPTPHSSGFSSLIPSLAVMGLIAVVA